MRRRVFGGLVEVYKEITSTCTWIAHKGCKSVDAFVVGGGDDGGVGDPFGCGKGGNGGQCSLYLNIPITTESIQIVVGGVSGRSYFKDDRYKAEGGKGKNGGSSISGNTSSMNGNPGQDGVYAFNNPSKFPEKFGASGGGGAAAGGNSGLGTYTGGKGGQYGAGTGGSSTWIINVPTTGEDGGNASFYGAGGGGGGKGVYTSNGFSKGGKGYQGIVILHYWAYSKS